LKAYSAFVGRWSLNSIDPLSRETYVINVHDAMCVEIRKVAVEACNELKKVRAKYLFVFFHSKH
jgi:hypothetical protein